MKKLVKEQKKIIVGYYWWIFRLPTFIHFAKPYLQHLYSSGYNTTYTFHSLNHYSNHTNNNYYGHSNNSNYNSHYDNHNYWR